VIPNFLSNKYRVNVEDFALNGRSTKSFLDEGRFAEALSIALPGDVCFISFGHNDEKIEDPKRYTTAFDTYQRNLVYMENEMKKKGVRTVFISSITRLKYDENNILKHTHGDYPKAMREIAKQLGDDFIDLEKITYDDLSKHTLEENQAHYMIFRPGEYENYPKGSCDTTHLCRNGATWICSLVVPEMKKIAYLTELFK
jgi:lysophospholipase L1-like esterase